MSAVTIEQERDALRGALKALDEQLDFSADIDDRHPLTEICTAHSVNEAFAKARAAMNMSATISETRALRDALAFYRDGFQLHPKRTRTGIDLSEWKPKKALLDDCGNIALNALEAR